MLNKNQMETDTTKLANALKKEPVEIQEIILNKVKEILNEYAENCCTTDVVKTGALDYTDKAEGCFSLPALFKASSYKNYGLRYFAFEASVSTYYGKKFNMIVEVSCEEHINDVFCTTLGGKTVLACNWLDPFKVEITEVNEREGLSWIIDSEDNAEIVEL